MFKLSFTNSIIIFFLLLSGADAAEVLTIKETVSGDFFGKREVALRAKYSCAIDENTDSYKFLLKALKIEGADLDDLTKTDILSVDSLKFIDELMLAKNKVESDLNDILCVQNNTGLVLHQYKGNSKNATNFGFLIISKYQFIKENNEIITSQRQRNVNSATRSDI